MKEINIDVLYKSKNICKN